MSELQVDPNTDKDHQIWDINTVRVNSDNSNKKVVVLFWGIFACLLVIVFITSNYTPSTFIFKSNRSELQDTHHKDCLNPVSFQNGILVCSQFNIQNPRLGLIMRNLSPLNQFAQINLIILPNSQDAQPLQIKQTISVELMSLKRTNIINNNKTYIGFEKGQDVKSITNIEFDTQTYYLQSVVTDEARIQYGYQINLGYYRQFKTQDALLIVYFANIDWSLFKNYKLVLTAILMNDNYTKFIMIMRGVFLGIMVITAALFLRRLKFRNNSLALSEQSLVINLSVSIILFNDPYYFIGVFKPNVFSIFIETLFLALFLMVLISSWIFMLEKINSETRGEQYLITGCKRWLNVIAALDCFALIFAFNYQIGYYAFNDSPIVPPHKIFSSLFMLTVVFFSLIFAYILYLYVRVFQVWEDIIWRHKLYVVFNIFFIFMLLVFISLGWFSLYDQSSQKFEILYASLNIYVIYMQYMYTPPFGEEEGEKLQEFHELEEVTMEMDEVINVTEPEVDLYQKNEKDFSYSAEKAKA